MRYQESEIERFAIVDCISMNNILYFLVIKYWLYFHLGSNSALGNFAHFQSSMDKCQSNMRYAGPRVWNDMDESLKALG